MDKQFNKNLESTFDTYMSDQLQCIYNTMVDLECLYDESFRNNQCTCQICNGFEIIRRQLEALIHALITAEEFNKTKEEGHKFLPDNTKKHAEEIRKVLETRQKLMKKFGFKEDKYERVQN